MTRPDNDPSLITTGQNCNQQTEEEAEKIRDKTRIASRSDHQPCCKLLLFCNTVSHKSLHFEANAVLKLAKTGMLFEWSSQNSPYRASAMILFIELLRKRTS